MTTPEKMTTVQEELLQQAHYIREWQEQRKLSDTQMLREYAGLGSTKTYSRIVNGDLDELDCERWLKNYQAVWNLVQLQQDSAANSDELYHDLTTVLDLRKAVGDAMRETGNNRLVILQGPSGSGKTTAARMLQARYGARIVFAEATELWKESASAMLSGILRALGCKNIPVCGNDKLEKVMEILRESRACLVIDEAHHLGPKTLNLVKSLINQTPGEIVLLAMHTLWARLETNAYSEAKQLTQNRLCERLQFKEAELVDVEKLVERRLGLNGQSRDGAKIIKSFGSNLAFARLVCTEARKLAGKADVTLEIVAKAAKSVLGTR